MEKKSVSRALLHLLFFIAVAMWLIAVFIRAARTEGYQILYSEGRHWDCANTVFMRVLRILKSDLITK